MTFSVGILYSAQEFLEFAGREALSVQQFAQQTRFSLVNADEILALSQECNWIRLTADGRIGVTERGRSVMSVVATESKLRLQIEDLMAFYRPAWALRIRFGRKETIDYMPNEVRQCFEECGLLADWTDPLISWWKIEAQKARLRHSERLEQTGHDAEYMSFRYELDRTGNPPDWVSLDTTFAGFDVLSRRSNKDSASLRIEVKGSERPPKSADFVLTRKEADTAKSSEHYVLHLWSIAGKPQLFVVPFEDVARHVPVDQQSGRWMNARIPFAPFTSFRVEL